MSKFAFVLTHTPAGSPFWGPPLIRVLTSREYPNGRLSSQSGCVSCARTDNWNAKIASRRVTQSSLCGWCYRRYAQIPEMAALAGSQRNKEPLQIIWLRIERDGFDWLRMVLFHFPGPYVFSLQKVTMPQMQLGG